MAGCNRMKITFDSLDDFFDFVPMILGTAVKNVDPESPAADFYDNIEKKMSTQINTYTRENPELRRKLKFMLSGLGNSNSTITIKADKEANEHDSITQYLTENYQTTQQIVRKYIK